MDVQHMGYEKAIKLSSLGYVINNEFPKGPQLNSCADIILKALCIFGKNSMLQSCLVITKQFLHLAFLEGLINHLNRYPIDLHS